MEVSMVDPESRKHVDGGRRSLSGRHFPARHAAVKLEFEGHFPGGTFRLDMRQSSWNSRVIFRAPLSGARVTTKIGKCSMKWLTFRHATFRPKNYERGCRKEVSTRFPAAIFRPKYRPFSQLTRSFLVLAINDLDANLPRNDTKSASRYRDLLSMRSCADSHWSHIPIGVALISQSVYNIQWESSNSLRSAHRTVPTRI